MNIQVPGRMDKRVIDGKTIIMDGAHNLQKMEAFVNSFKKQYSGEKATVLLSMKTGKEYQDVLPLLRTITDKVIVCGFSLVQDTRLQSRDVETLAAAARSSGFNDVIVVNEPGEAYKRLLAETEEVGIITGSLYLIGELRRLNKELR